MKCIPKHFYSLIKCRTLVKKSTIISEFEGIFFMVRWMLLMFADINSNTILTEISSKVNNYSIEIQHIICQFLDLSWKFLLNVNCLKHFQPPLSFKKLLRDSHRLETTSIWVSSYILTYHLNVITVLKVEFTTRR